jgi:hypothetical protein
VGRWDIFFSNLRTGPLNLTVSTSGSCELLVLRFTAWIQRRVTHGPWPIESWVRWLLDVVAMACLNGSAVAHLVEAH